MKENILKKFVEAPKCPKCGGEMLFSPENMKLKCTQCGTLKSIPKSKKVKMYEIPISELPTQDYEKIILQENQEAVINKDEDITQCSNCGASFYITSSKITTHCPFCGSSKINTSKLNQDKLKPDLIIPFKLSKEQVIQKFDNWRQKIKSLFVNNKFKKNVKIENIEALYVPSWLFEISITAEYEVKIEIKERIKKNGETEFETLVKYDTSEIEEQYQLLEAGIQNNIIQDNLFYTITPYKIEKIFEEIGGANLYYLLGFETPVYNRNIKDAYQNALKRAKEKLEYSIKSKYLPGHVTFLKLNTKIKSVKVTQLMLPIYVIKYKIGNKQYHAIVNGYTGEVAGEKPLNLMFILALATIILLIIGGIVFLYLKGMHKVAAYSLIGTFILGILASYYIYQEWLTYKYD